jgi:hypothetical protein
METTFSQKSDAKKQHSPIPDCQPKHHFRAKQNRSNGGNAFILQRLPVQPKLVVGQPNDPLEQEADRVAEMVQSGSHQSAQTASTEADSVQRNVPSVRKKRKKFRQNCSEPVQHRLRVCPSPDAGSALSKEVRSRVEPVLVDLSHVRVHSSPSAQATAKDLNAKALLTKITFG